MTRAGTRAAKVPVPKRSERAIQREIIRLLRAHGIVCYPLNRERAGRQRANHIGVKGLPDIGGWLPGGHRLVGRACAVPIFVEVKRPGGKLRLEQDVFLKQARKDGCVALLATSPADVAVALGL